MDTDFDEYVVTRSGALLRLAYLLTGDGHRAEDLVQDTLERLCRRRYRRRPRHGPRHRTQHRHARSLQAVQPPRPEPTGSSSTRRGGRSPSSTGPSPTGPTAER
ncbi:sigma factor [Nocardioides sp. NBC_00368]|uniref:sigma factor n=1 Tax=Nocardioides sp. NBC_00368 TaxID=2976000 RepID=UPI003FA5DF10